MIWAVFGILHSIFRAAFAEVNRIFRVDGTQLCFWNAIFGMVFMLPFLPFIEWGLPIFLYVTALIVGLVFTAGALMQLILTAQKKARVTSMHVPIEVFVAFIIWFFMMPDVLSDLLSSPQKISLLGLGYILSTIGLMRIRKNDMGVAELFAVLPGALSLGAAAVLIKLVIPAYMLPHAAFTFVLISYAIMALLLGFVLLLRKEADKSLFNTELIHAGSLAGIFSASAFICFIYALAYVSNPAYPVILLMLVPVWLMILHKIKKVEDTASPQAAIVIILGAAFLIAGGI
jgi:hypothetical protein